MTKEQKNNALNEFKILEKESDRLRTSIKNALNRHLSTINDDYLDMEKFCNQ